MKINRNSKPEIRKYINASQIFAQFLLNNQSRKNIVKKKKAREIKEFLKMNQLLNDEKAEEINKPYSLFSKESILPKIVKRILDEGNENKNEKQSDLFKCKQTIEKLGKDSKYILSKEYLLDQPKISEEYIRKKFK